MNKAKLFLENFIVYGLGGIISKMIPLVMLPIITRLMPNTTYFGISDLSNTAVSFGSALAVIGMYDAMYRLFFEKDEEDFKKIVCSTTLVFTVSMSIVVSVLMVCFKDIIARYFFSDIKYAYLVYITAVTTLVSATNQIVSAPTRMQNKRKVFLITNAVSPILAYSISIPLILKGFYVIALPVSGLVAGITMEASFWFMNRGWFKVSLFDKNVLKQLLYIAIPLFPNFLIYWLFNSSDKLMITNLLSVGEAGIYSIGSKLGHLSQLIYTAFAGGWQYFAFSTMKENNQVKSNSLVFEYLGAISFMSSMFIFAMSKTIYEIFFAGDYVKGFIVAPYLFLAPLMQMLFQVAANQFLIIKRTWPNMFILATGAIINIVLNLYLIPIIGIEGASIATLVGYTVSNIICCIVLGKMDLIIVSKRFIYISFLMILFIVIWRCYAISSLLISLLIACLFSCAIAYMYREELGTVISIISRKSTK